MNKKRILYNIITGLLSQCIAFVLAFLIPRLFLVNFGSEIKGLTSTITQIFAYLWLLEAGVGLATLQALYGPVSQDHTDTINAILAATDRYYRRTGYIYLAIVLLFAAGFSLFSETPLAPSVTFFLILLQGLPNVLSYLIQGKYRLLLEAEGKSYILNNLETGKNLLVNLGKAFLLCTTDNLLLIQSVSSVGFLIQIALLLIYIRKHYKWLDLKHSIPDFQAISQRSFVLVHQLSGVIFNNTDMILLSALCGFKTASVYSVYYAFFSYAEKLIQILSSSITFSLGQLFHTSKKRFLKYHDAYETGYMMFIFIIYTNMYLFLTPIIRLYTRGITDADYIDPLLVLFFVLVNLLANGKLPSNQVIIFAEHFQSTKSHAVIEAGINIAVSIAAIRFWGIYGGLLGTIAALLYRGNIMILYASRRVLFRSPFCTYKKWLVNFLLFIAIGLFARRAYFDLTSYGAIFLAAIPVGLITSLCYLLVNLLTQPNFVSVIRDFFRERRN